MSTSTPPSSLNTSSGPITATTPAPFPPPNYIFTHYPTAPPDPLFTALFNLLKDNMKTLYQRSTMGWSATKKRTEMRSPKLQYLVLRQHSTPPSDLDAEPDVLAAFASCVVTTEGVAPVMYLYEIQVDPAHQGKRLGEALMREVERMAVEARKKAEAEGKKREMVEKVMLTVFSENTGARRFYQRLGYEVDPCSPVPSKRSRSGKEVEPSFYIFSKTITTQ